MKKDVDVFISHSNRDRKLADALCRYFEGRGLTCWIAPRDINKRAGIDYAESIIEGIRASRMMVVVFNRFANGSNFVKNEIERAFHYKLPILPFRTDTTKPSGKLELFLSAIHWLDAFGGKPERLFDELYKNATTLLGKPYVQLALTTTYKERLTQEEFPGKQDIVDTADPSGEKKKNITRGARGWPKSRKITVAGILVTLLVVVLFLTVFKFPRKNTGTLTGSTGNDTAKLKEPDSLLRPIGDTGRKIIIPPTPDTSRTPGKATAYALPADPNWRSKYDTRMVTCRSVEQQAAEDEQLLASNFAEYARKRPKDEIMKPRYVLNWYAAIPGEIAIPQNATKEWEFVRAKIKFWQDKTDKEDYFVRKCLGYIEEANILLDLGASNDIAGDIAYIDKKFTNAYNSYKKTQVKDYIISRLTSKAEFISEGAYHDGLVGLIKKFKAKS